MNLLDIAIAKKMSGGGGSEPVIEALSVTENGTYSAPSGVDGYSPVTVNVSGGGGIGTLITTQSLGALSTTSETAIDSGVDLTIPDIKNSKYDVLLVCISNDSPTSGRLNGTHISTISFIVLYNNSDASLGVTGATASSTRLNYKKDYYGTLSSRQNAYGVYPTGAAFSSNDLTTNIMLRYNSTETGAIDGDYTAQVYGINLYDLIP